MVRKSRLKKYHYTYKTTCIVTGKYYYGMHSTKNLDDGYLGSGNRIKYSVNKYGNQNHKRVILEFFDNRNLLINAEIKLINEYEIMKKSA